MFAWIKPDSNLIWAVDSLKEFAELNYERDMVYYEKSSAYKNIWSGNPVLCDGYFLTKYYVSDDRSGRDEQIKLVLWDASKQGSRKSWRIVKTEPMRCHGDMPCFIPMPHGDMPLPIIICCDGKLKYMDDPVYTDLYNDGLCGMVEQGSCPGFYHKESGSLYHQVHFCGAPQHRGSIICTDIERKRGMVVTRFNFGCVDSFSPWDDKTIVVGFTAISFAEMKLLDLKTGKCHSMGIDNYCYGCVITMPSLNKICILRDNRLLINDVRNPSKEVASLDAGNCDYDCGVWGLTETSCMTFARRQGWTASEMSSTWKWCDVEKVKILHSREQRIFDCAAASDAQSGGTCGQDTADTVYLRKEEEERVEWLRTAAVGIVCIRIRSPDDGYITMDRELEWGVPFACFL